MCFSIYDRDGVWRVVLLLLQGIGIALGIAAFVLFTMEMQAAPASTPYMTPAVRLWIAHLCVYALEGLLTLIAICRRDIGLRTFLLLCLFLVAQLAVTWLSSRAFLGNLASMAPPF